MENQPATALTASESLRSKYVYGMAAICLVAGLTTGYLLQGWQSRRLPAQLAANGAAPTFGQSVSGVRLAGTQPQPAVNGASASAHTAGVEPDCRQAGGASAGKAEERSEQQR